VSKFVLYCYFLHLFVVAAQSAAAGAVLKCSKKPSDAESSHVLDFMLEEPGTAADDDLSAGPKRCGFIHH